MDIEKEIQARVDFKMKEILTAVENRAKANWNKAFHNYSQKHSHYWEAFNQLKSMIKTEIEMETPFDDMVEQKLRKNRDIAINKIMGRFCKRGTVSPNDYYRKERLLVSIIEDIQR